MFGFFSRNQQPAAKVPNLPSDPMVVDSEPPQQLRTPSPSEAAFHGLGQQHPSTTMTPPPGPSIPAVPPTPEALHSLVTSIPAKTLHAYVLDNIPAAPPDTLAVLASFFATLSPPPLLHCARCHEDYTDIENGDRSCRVPHDDDSAEVEWVGHKRGDSDYETYYGCCGKTVEGEGDLGPPDGWCYEGMHTVSEIKSIALSRLPLWKPYFAFMLIFTLFLCHTTDGRKTCTVPRRFDQRRGQAGLLLPVELPQHPRTVPKTKGTCRRRRQHKWTHQARTCTRRRRRR